MHWIHDAVFYNIYPLGFCGAPKYNDFQLTSRLDKLYDFIPHFKKMGVNCIVFNPVFESTKHGYDTIDYRKIDSRLGDNESFKKICGALHENGIRVLLDVVLHSCIAVAVSSAVACEQGFEGSFRGFLVADNLKGEAVRLAVVVDFREVGSSEQDEFAGV